MSRCLVVTITGNIGVGATTLGRRLLESEPAFFNCLAADAGDANPYLEDFYRDPRRWGFPHQVHSLARSCQRYHALVARLESSSGVFVQDKAIEEHNGVFARALAAEGSLDTRDLHTLEMIHRHAGSILPCPNALVALHVSPEVLFRRVQARARKGEVTITVERLQLLGALFVELFNSWPTGPVLHVDAEARDLRIADIDDIMKWIGDQKEA